MTEDQVKARMSRFRWSKEEDDLLLLRMHRCLDGSETEWRRSWTQVVADMLVDGARLGYSRHYSAENISSRFYNHLQERYNQLLERYRQEREEQLTERPTLASLEDVIGGINNAIAQAGDNLQPVRATGLKVTSPTLPSLKEVVDGINNEIAQMGYHLPLVRATGLNVTNASLQVLEMEAQATGRLENIMRYGDRKGKGKE